jgi:hypothetical protein
MPLAAGAALSSAEMVSINSKDLSDVQHNEAGLVA